MTPSKKLSLSDIKKLYLEKVQSFFSNEGALDNFIETEIRENTRTVIWHALGLEKTWAGVKVASNYNDSERAEPIIKFIREKATEAANEWVTEVLEGDFMPELSASGERRMVAYYRKVYLGRLEEVLRDTAREIAEKDAEKYIKGLKSLKIALLPEKVEIKTAYDEDEDDDDDDDGGDSMSDKYEVEQTEKMFKKNPKG